MHNNGRKAINKPYQLRAALILALLAAALGLLCGCGAMLPGVPADAAVIKHTEEALTGWLSACVLEQQEEAVLYVLPDGNFDTQTAAMEQTISCALDRVWPVAGYVQKLEWQFEELRDAIALSITFTYHGRCAQLEEYLAAGLSPAPMTYSDELFSTWLRQRMYAGDEDCMLLVQGENCKASIDAIINDFSKNDPDYIYAVRYLEWSTTQYDNCTEACFTLTYAPDVLPLSQIPVVTSPEEGVAAILDTWRSGTDEVTLRVTNSAIPESHIWKWAFLAEGLSEAYYGCASEWVSGWVYPAEGNDRIAVLELYEYVSDDVRRSLSQEALLAAQAIAQEVQESGAKGDKALYRAAHDALIRRVQYNDEIAALTEGAVMSAADMQKKAAYGALVLGDTVCTGYARAYKAVCNALSLPCCVVYGEQDGGEHAWNAVLQDGDVYYVDCTFSDTGGSGAYAWMTEKDLRDRDYVLDEACILYWEGL